MQSLENISRNFLEDSSIIFSKQFYISRINCPTAVVVYMGILKFELNCKTYWFNSTRALSCISDTNFSVWLYTYKYEIPTKTTVISHLWLLYFKMSVLLKSFSFTIQYFTPYFNLPHNTSLHFMSVYSTLICINPPVFPFCPL